MTGRFPLDPVVLTQSLVAIDSRNPDLVPGAPGESACANHLADVLSEWGFAVSIEEIAPGRSNVLARVGPSGKSPLILNGHLDVVGTDNMVHPPFTPDIRGGRVYGRGSTDMKSGIACMCVAAARASTRSALASEIIIAAVCDEEFGSLGTRTLLANGLHATAAIVTEPTRLAVCTGHRGFAWIRIDVAGHAAHGSRYDIGVDAIMHAGLLLAAIDRFDTTTLPPRAHALLGRPSLHASLIEGGTGWSTYPESCTLRIERRTVPGETGESVKAEFEALCRELHNSRPSFQTTVTLELFQPASDLAADAQLTVAVATALEKENLPAPIEGLSCWTDAALFNEAGIPALCFGPGDIALAHSAEEWVTLEHIHHATAVLERVCASWGR
ncbi:MAG: ArgE/DapE family deacylase [Phycisphaerae bacterium]|nr:ArgE/DapE family deacylase [Gemmatimonadaceae bacterium]